MDEFQYFCIEIVDVVGLGLPGLKPFYQLNDRSNTVSSISSDRGMFPDTL